MMGKLLLIYKSSRYWVTLAFIWSFVCVLLREWWEEPQQYSCDWTVKLWTIKHNKLRKAKVIFFSEFTLLLTTLTLLFFWIVISYILTITIKAILTLFWINSKDKAIHHTSAVFDATVTFSHAEILIDYD